MLFMPLNDCRYLEDKFRNKGSINVKRKMFDFNEYKFHECQKSILNTSHLYTITKIDAESTKKYDDFKRVTNTDNKFGFCIIDNESILGYCISVAVGDNKEEIDIFTDEAYRNRGLAQMMAVAYISHCLKNNIVPVWSCWEDRTASVNLAKSLGFVEAENFTAVLWTECL